MNIIFIIIVFIIIILNVIFFILFSTNINHNNVSNTKIKNLEQEISKREFEIATNKNTRYITNNIKPIIENNENKYFEFEKSLIEYNKSESEYKINKIKNSIEEITQKKENEYSIEKALFNEKIKSDNERIEKLLNEKEKIIEETKLAFGSSYEEQMNKYNMKINSYEEKEQENLEKFNLLSSKKELLDYQVSNKEFNYQNILKSIQENEINNTNKLIQQANAIKSFYSDKEYADALLYSSNEENLKSQLTYLNNQINFTQSQLEQKERSIDEDISFIEDNKINFDKSYNELISQINNKYSLKEYSLNESNQIEKSNLEYFASIKEKSLLEDKSKDEYLKSQKEYSLNENIISLKEQASNKEYSLNEKEILLRNSYIEQNNKLLSQQEDIKAYYSGREYSNTLLDSSIEENLKIQISNLNNQIENTQNLLSEKENSLNNSILSASKQEYSLREIQRTATGALKNEISEKEYSLNERIKDLKIEKSETEYLASLKEKSYREDESKDELNASKREYSINQNIQSLKEQASHKEYSLKEKEILLRNSYIEENNKLLSQQENIKAYYSGREYSDTLLDSSIEENYKKNISNLNNVIENTENSLSEKENSLNNSILSASRKEYSLKELQTTTTGTLRNQLSEKEYSLNERIEDLRTEKSQAEYLASLKENSLLEEKSKDELDASIKEKSINENLNTLKLISSQKEQSLNEMENLIREEASSKEELIKRSLNNYINSASENEYALNLQLNNIQQKYKEYSQDEYSLKELETEMKRSAIEKINNSISNVEYNEYINQLSQEELRSQIENIKAYYSGREYSDTLLDSSIEENYKIQISNLNDKIENTQKSLLEKENLLNNSILSASRQEYSLKELQRTATGTLRNEISEKEYSLNERIEDLKIEKSQAEYLSSLKEKSLLEEKSKDELDASKREYLINQNIQSLKEQASKKELTLNNSLNLEKSKQEEFSKQEYSLREKEKLASGLALKKIQDELNATKDNENKLTEERNKITNEKIELEKQKTDEINNLNNKINTINIDASKTEYSLKEYHISNMENILHNFGTPADNTILVVAWNKVSIYVNNMSFIFDDFIEKNLDMPILGGVFNSPAKNNNPSKIIFFALARFHTYIFNLQDYNYEIYKRNDSFDLEVGSGYVNNRNPVGDGTFNKSDYYSLNVSNSIVVIGVQSSSTKIDTKISDNFHEGYSKYLVQNNLWWTDDLINWNPCKYIDKINYGINLIPVILGIEYNNDIWVAWGWGDHDVKVDTNNRDESIANIYDTLVAASNDGKTWSYVYKKKIYSNWYSDPFICRDLKFNYNDKCWYMLVLGGVLKTSTCPFKNNVGDYNFDFKELVNCANGAGIHDLTEHNTPWFWNFNEEHVKEGKYYGHGYIDYFNSLCFARTTDEKPTTFSTIFGTNWFNLTLNAYDSYGNEIGKKLPQEYADHRFTSNDIKYISLKTNWLKGLFTSDNNAFIDYLYGAKEPSRPEIPKGTPKNAKIPFYKYDYGFPDKFYNLFRETNQSFCTLGFSESSNIKLTSEKNNKECLQLLYYAPENPSHHMGPGTLNSNENLSGKFLTIRRLYYTGMSKFKLKDALYFAEVVPNYFEYKYQDVNEPYFVLEDSKLITKYRRKNIKCIKKWPYFNLWYSKDGFNWEPFTDVSSMTHFFIFNVDNNHPPSNSNYNFNTNYYSNDEKINFDNRGIEVNTSSIYYNLSDISNGPVWNSEDAKKLYYENFTNTDYFTDINYFNNTYNIF